MGGRPWPIYTSRTRINIQNAITPANARSQLWTTIPNIVVSSVISFKAVSIGPGCTPRAE